MSSPAFWSSTPKRLTAALCRRLTREGFAAESVATAQAAQVRLAAQAFALVVVDPGLQGVDVASLARAPRGLVTLGRADDLLQRVIVLEIGADDSLGKPVHLQEIVARIRAVLRCPGPAPLPPTAGETTRFDGWEVERVSRRPTSPVGAPVPPSDADHALPTACLETPRQVVSRAQWLARARGTERGAPGRSIDLRVSRLRHKLGSNDGGGGPIRTVRGASYVRNIRSISG